MNRRRRSRSSAAGHVLHGSSREYRRQGLVWSPGEPFVVGIDSRGYSLLVVLLVLVVVALVGLTAVTVATLGEGAAAARTKRTQAMAAGETGLAIYSGLAAPNVDCIAPPGSPLLAGDLPTLDTNQRAGGDLRPRFSISVGAQTSGFDGCSVEVLGEVLDGGNRVVGRALLGATVQHQRSNWGYGAQKDSNRGGTGSDLSGSFADL